MAVPRRAMRHLAASFILKEALAQSSPLPPPLSVQREEPLVLQDSTQASSATDSQVVSPISYHFVLNFFLCGPVSRADCEILLFTHPGEHRSLGQCLLAGTEFFLLQCFSSTYSEDSFFCIILSLACCGGMSVLREQ